MARAFVLTHPGQFEEKSRHLPSPPPPGDAVVQPTLGSICAADLRYYLGHRRPEALRKKLPMALLHEAIGTVEDCAAEGLRPGDRVVLIPNIPGYIHSPEQFPSPEQCCPACASAAIGENYCANCRFLSSGSDGFLQSRLVHPVSCLAKVPGEVPDDVAVLAELASVTLCAVLRTLGLRMDVEWPQAGAWLEAAAASEIAGADDFHVGVWGDGPVGYCVAVWLSFLGIPRERLLVFGANPSKLAHFDFATTANVAELSGRRSPCRGRLAAAFECVGGDIQSIAANDAIDCLRPGGKLGLLGVNEGLTSLNVRDVLERGLVLFGCSRSPRQAYPLILGLMASSEQLRERFRALAHSPLEVSDIGSLQRAFNHASANAEWGKVLLRLRL